MKTKIFFENNTHGVLDFYLLFEDGSHYLFSRRYTHGAYDFYLGGRFLEEAIDISKAKGNHAVMNVMKRILPMVRYLEKELQISVLEQTKRKMRLTKLRKEKFCL